MTEQTMTRRLTAVRDHANAVRGAMTDAMQECASDEPTPATHAVLVEYHARATRHIAAAARLLETLLASDDTSPSPVALPHPEPANP